MSERPAKVVFKNNLRNIRIVQNPRMSQWMLALKSNVPQSKISLIENYLINPTQEEKESLASALNINISNIFSDGQVERSE